MLLDTLEQVCIAAVICLGRAVLMPAQAAAVIPLAAVAFAIRRVLFFAGFRNGAAARALGFGLTFKPSIAMLLYMAGFASLQHLI